jgi:peptide/nickel transport system permease protein
MVIYFFRGHVVAASVLYDIRSIVKFGLQTKLERSKNQRLNQSQQRAWRRFRRNKLAMGGLVFILLVALVSVLGTLIRPDKSKNANNQILSIAAKKPGFKVKVLILKNEEEESGIFENWWNGGTERVENAIALAEGTRVDLRLNDGLCFYEYGSTEEKCIGDTQNWDIEERVYVLGTDKYGRDLLSRLMAGTVISLAVGAIAVLISLLVGLTLGLIAGYYRGWVDSLIMWFTNVVWAIPTLLLVMAITFAFGTGFWKVFLAVGLTMWVEVARIARGQVLGIREKEYIEAARALGFRDFRIIFKHVLPNIWSPVIVISAANFASAILIEAGLSFLGLGAQIPTPSWGNMIREHYSYITTDLAYLALIPGLLIMLLVLSFMMIGNGLRDALDVKS